MAYSTCAVMCYGVQYLCSDVLWRTVPVCDVCNGERISNNFLHAVFRHWQIGRRLVVTPNEIPYTYFSLMLVHKHR